jgi:Acyl-CoA dehydrogenase, N-terminal domain
VKLINTQRCKGGMNMATSTTVPNARITGGDFLLEERQPEEIFTPEDFTEQHTLIAHTAEEFATNEIIPNIEKMERKDFSINRELVRKAGELGSARWISLRNTGVRRWTR